MRSSDSMAGRVRERCNGQQKRSRGVAAILTDGFERFERLGGVRLVAGDCLSLIYGSCDSKQGWRPSSLGRAGNAGCRLEAL